MTTEEKVFEARKLLGILTNIINELAASGHSIQVDANIENRNYNRQRIVFGSGHQISTKLSVNKVVEY
jgi:hypothetical protein